MFQGVNKERAPFVLTPDFEYVMGKRVSLSVVFTGSSTYPFPPPLIPLLPIPPLSLISQNSETFRRFEETAVKAYMIIRKNANVLINLFSMVSSC